jgi:mannose-6-phosphate isomerase-like protein (cupin superfamily)
MIMKYNLFDIGGEIIRNDDVCIIRENNELNNVWLNSILLYNEKATKLMSFLDQDCVYVFVDGKGILEVEKEIIYVNRNDIVLVPQNSLHRVINIGDTHLRFLVMKERL